MAKVLVRSVHVLRIQGRRMAMTVVEHLICTDMTGNSAARRRTPTTVGTGGFLTHVEDASGGDMWRRSQFQGKFLFSPLCIQLPCILYSYRMDSTTNSYKYKKCTATHLVCIASKDHDREFRMANLRLTRFGTSTENFRPKIGVARLMTIRVQAVKYKYTCTGVGFQDLGSVAIGA